MPSKKRAAEGPRREKPTGQAARFGAARKNENDLLADCERLLLAEALEPDDRRQDVIHPSEMAKSDWCPRSTYLRIKLARAGVLKPGEAHHFQLENIFEEGHEYHRKWQTRFRRMGRLQGLWKCEACRCRWFDVSPMRCDNEDCRAPANCLTYLEVPLSDPETLIYGSADGEVISDDTGLIEVKSIGEGTIRMEMPRLLQKHTHDVVGEWNKTTKVLDTRGVWKEITSPFGPHLRQGFIYLKLRGLMSERFDLVPVERITFIYEFKPTSAVKAFDIRRDDDAIEHLWESAKDIVYALEGGREPSCTNRDESCKQCQVYEEQESEHDRRTASPEGEAEEEPRGRRRPGQAGSAAAVQAEDGRTRLVRSRPDGSRGRRPDGPARPADEVGGLLGRAARRS